MRSATSANFGSTSKTARNSASAVNQSPISAAARPRWYLLSRTRAVAVGADSSVAITSVRAFSLNATRVACETSSNRATAVLVALAAPATRVASTARSSCWRWRESTSTPQTISQIANISISNRLAPKRDDSTPLAVTGVTAADGSWSSRCDSP